MDMDRPQSAPRCAVLSRAQDEPLAGTAPFAPRWLCLEHRGAWPRYVAAHPDPAVAALTRRAAAAGWRLQLIRRPGRRVAAHEPVRVLLADTTPRSPQVTALEVTGPPDLDAIVLPAPGAPLPGVPVTDPLLLVCTHGRRDRCCALDGRAMVAELAGEPDVWECTHLGGHRFAPTALVLPTGYLYGRLDATTAVGARKAAGLGEMEPERCRGRSTWSGAGQVAELAVRIETGLRDADALDVALLDTAAGAGEVLVTARDGRHWAVTVEPDHRSVTRPASCGGIPEQVAALRAVAVRPLA